jgi:hypothetical protein
VLVALNFTGDERSFEVPAALKPVAPLAGTHDEPRAATRIVLGPHEGQLLRLA